MTQKRPFDDEVVSEVSSKHPRQDGPTHEIISHDDSIPTEDCFDKPNGSGMASFLNSESETQEDYANKIFPEIPSGDVEITETEIPRSASLSHRATSSTSDKDEPHDLLHVSFFPGYFSFDRPVRSVINPDDVYYCLLDYPPRKQVPVGPEFQADIPELDSHGKDKLGTNSSPDDEQFDGICIIPSPDNVPLPYNGERVGDGRIDCNCQDQATIRCVRQHIAEARDKLTSTHGKDTLLELGFYDMGEIVAEKWGEEEEQLFHEVVYSNPASLGRNFWNALSAVFPSRTQMEVVSYYFNVFMLRKRAAQNRCDSFTIDSDNDEWQGSDDDDDDDDDSGVESPVRQDGIIDFHQNGYLSDEAQENDDYDGLSYARKSDPDSTSDLPGNKSGGENDPNDGSCTSSDSGGAEQVAAEMKPESCQEWHDGYLVESSDAKAWDVYNNLTCPKNDIDFLPTCSMIEEVFGDADFDSNDKRW